MEISQGLLCRMILYAAGVGAMLGVIYDAFRILRIATRPAEENASRLPAFLGRLRPTEKVLFAISVFIEDIVFSVIAGIIVAVFIFNCNDGQVRWFALMGTFLGFYLYYHTVGRLVILAADWILRLIRKLISLLMRVTVYPVFFAVGCLLRAAVALTVTVRDFLASRRLTNALLRDAARGFRM